MGDLYRNAVSALHIQGKKARASPQERRNGSPRGATRAPAVAPPRAREREPARGQVLAQRGDEVLSFDGVQLHGRARSDGRGARHAVRERDLPETVTPVERSSQCSVHDDLDLAVRDHVEAIALVALRHDRSPPDWNLLRERGRVPPSRASAAAGAEGWRRAQQRKQAGRGQSHAGRSRAAGSLAESADQGEGSAPTSDERRARAAERVRAPLRAVIRAASPGHLEALREARIPARASPGERPVEQSSPRVSNVERAPPGPRRAAAIEKRRARA